MSVDFVIRNYCKEDKLSVLHLIQLNTPTYFAKQEEQDLVHYLENELEEYFVIEKEGEIIGSGGINFKSIRNDRIGVISWDLIHPKHQDLGIGGQLLEYRLKQLKVKYNCKNIIVRTSQHVYKFYEKFGFEIDEIKENYWSKGFDLYSMKYFTS